MMVRYPHLTIRRTLPPSKKVSYPKAMTIAAGFVYSDGVLLCADSQIETPGQKGWGQKVARITQNWGAMAGVISGNVDYATAAFQALEREAEKGPMEIDAVASCLRGSYRRNVFKHPLSSHSDLWYSLLLTVWKPSMDRARLYVTNEWAFREVTTYRCEGIGRDVGHTVLKPLWRPEMDLQSVMRLGAYMLAIVKNNVPGCGGPSQFATINSAGSLELRDVPVNVAHIENVYGWFDQVSSEFILKHMCESDADFEAYLNALQAQARHMRNLWKEQLKAAEQSSPQSTTADPSRQRPSQE